MKLLLLKPDALGDDILITPVISALKKKYPGSHLAVMAEAQSLSIFENNPEVDEVIRDYLFKREKPFWRMVKETREKKFDLVINYRKEGRYALLALFSGAKWRVGDKAKILWGWVYNKGVFLPWNKLWLTHQVLINLMLLEKLGITDRDLNTKMYTATEAEEKIKNLLAENGITTSDFLVGIHPSTGSGNKPYLPESYAKVAEALIKSKSLKVILLGGGEKDRALADKIKQSCSLPLVDLTGKTSLLELAALIKRLNLYIGVDSGPMHIASALKVPIVFISPSKSQKPQRWGPWKSPSVLVREADQCPLVHCDPSRCRDSYCVEAIKPEEVISAALKLMGITN